MQVAVRDIKNLSGSIGHWFIRLQNDKRPIGHKSAYREQMAM